MKPKMDAHHHTPPRGDPDGAHDLVPLDQVSSPSEIAVVSSMLQAAGIMVVTDGLHNPRAPLRILVPRGSLGAAQQLLDGRLRGGLPRDPPQQAAATPLFIRVLGLAVVALAIYAIYMSCRSR